MRQYCRILLFVSIPFVLWIAFDSALMTYLASEGDGNPLPDFLTQAVSVNNTLIRHGTHVIAFGLLFGGPLFCIGILRYTGSLQRTIATNDDFQRELFRLQTCLLVATALAALVLLALFFDAYSLLRIWLLLVVWGYLMYAFALTHAFVLQRSLFEDTYSRWRPWWVMGLAFLLHIVLWPALLVPVAVLFNARRQFRRRQLSHVRA